MSGKSHVYGYDQSDASWHYVGLSSSKELKTADSDTHSKLDQIVTNTGSGGDASAANQVTGNNSLSSIDGKISACNTSAVVISSGVVTETNSGVISNTLQNISLGQATESTLSSIDGKMVICNTGGVVVSSGSVTETNSGTINSTLASISSTQATESTLFNLDSKVAVCNTGAVVVSSSALPTGGSTETKQDSIITKLDEMNDGANTLETFTTSSLGFDNTTSKNTTNYSSYSVIVNSTQSDTALVIQGSQNNTDWYHVDYYTSVNSYTDPDGVSDTQYNFISYNAVISSKYMRVRLYSPTAATVKVSFNLLH